MTLFALTILAIYLMPMAYGVITSLKSKAQTSDPGAPVWPAEAVSFEYEGDNYDVLQVPTESGIRHWALVKKGRRASQFVDPANPAARADRMGGQLAPARAGARIRRAMGQLPAAWETIDFARLLANTLLYAFITMFGTVAASSCAAYGFARFNFPFKNLLFMIMIGTIVLPPAVTLVPTYAFFVNVLDWGGTWLPLIVPAMFGNAYNIFLLRQYFLTIPREMEEAAQIDGAGRIRTFVAVILPQAVPALTAVSLFPLLLRLERFLRSADLPGGQSRSQSDHCGLDRI